MMPNRRNGCPCDVIVYFYTRLAGEAHDLPDLRPARTCVPVLLVFRCLVLSTVSVSLQVSHDNNSGPQMHTLVTCIAKRM